MYSPALILLSLSAGALANTANLYLTAFPAGSTCTGAPAGNNVTIPIPLVAGQNYTSPCIPYEPDKGQLIQVDHPSREQANYHLHVFSDTECTASANTTNPVGFHGDVVICYSQDGEPNLEMDATDVVWKSVQLVQNHYEGKLIGQH